MMDDEWRPISGMDGLYDVSRDGRVRSRARMVRGSRGGLRPIPERELRPRIVRGYCHVTLQVAGCVKQASIHRLVAAAFLVPDENRCFVNHKDGDKRNNSAANLEWVTTAENNKHSFDAGLRSNAGEANAHAVLSQAQVKDIRSRLKRGETCVSIARDYPVTDRAISRIKRRKCWSHI